MNKQVAKKIDSVKGSIENLMHELTTILNDVENNKNFTTERGNEYCKKSINEHLKVSLQDLENSFSELSKIDLKDKEI